MLILKPVLPVVLAALLASFTTPPPFLQDPGAGRPDDVAELLPANTFFFSEIVRPPTLLRDWKEYVGAWTTPEGKSEACDLVEKAFGEGAKIIPERLWKDLQAGFPSMQRLAIAVLPPENAEVAWALVATSSDPAFFPKIVEEDLRVFSSEEKVVQGVKVLAIRKLGEHEMPAPVLVAASGRRLFVTTHWPTLEAILDRAAGKGKGEDLRKSPLYRELAPSGDEARLRAFCTLDFSSLFSLMGAGTRQRYSAFSMDQGDAALEFRRFQGYVLDAELRPGRITNRARILVESPCRLFDMIRQPAGSKELARHIPAESVLGVHLNLRGGTQILKDIEDMVHRFEKVQELSRKAEGREGDEGPVDRDFVGQMHKEFEREIGVPLRDVAAAVGTEAFFAMIGDDAFAGEMNAANSFVLGATVTDPAKAKELLGKVTAHLGSYEAKADGAATIWQRQGEEMMPVFGLNGTTAYLAMKPEPIQAAIKASATGPFAKHFAGHEKASMMAALRHRGIWNLVKAAGAAPPEDLEKKLNLDGVTVAASYFDERGVTTTSVDGGLGFVSSVAMAAAPGLAVAVPFFFRAVMAGGMAPVSGDVIRPRPAPVPDGPKMDKEKLEAIVKENLEKLRSDEMVARDDATDALRQLGRQAVPLLVDAAKKEADPEARSRLCRILMDWRAYDAWPELLQRKADSFLGEWAKAAIPDKNQWGSGYVYWDMERMGFGLWAIEPYSINSALPRSLENGDFLDFAESGKILAERLAGGKLEPESRKALAMLLAFTESPGSGPAVLQAISAETDAETKVYLQVALGWSKDPKALEALAAGFKSPDKWICRASFIGAEQSGDPRVVGKLLELLKDADLEVRWNAGYTLRRLLGRQVPINMFLPEKEYEAQVGAAHAWWEANRATWKFVR